MPTTGTRDVPDLGKCTASLVEDRFYEGVFKLLCESPGELRAANIRLSHAPSGREWKERLNSSITYSPGPHETWFSPLKRSQTFFRLTDKVTTHPGARYLVPTEYLPSAQLHITPEIVTGAAISHFEFRNADLRSAFGSAAEPARR